jgi:tRNA U34 5-carboxymethylaminomethyl modifying enzyme MnmG/GidA
MNHCKKEYEASQAHELKTKELSKIFANFGKANNIGDIDKLFKDFKKLAFKSPQITYSKCVYNKCKDTTINAIESTLKLFETLYNTKKEAVSQSYAPIILQRCHKLLEKKKHSANEILQISFYTILLVFLYMTNVSNK